MPIGYLCRSCQRCMDRDEVKVCTDKKGNYYRCTGKKNIRKCKEIVSMMICTNIEQQRMNDSLVKIGASLSKSS